MKIQTLMALLLFMLHGQLTLAAKNKTEASSYQSSIEFSAEETAWIQAHPVIRMGYDPFFPPLEYVDESGAYKGVASDYIKLLNTRLGLNIVVAPNLKDWKIANEKGKNKALDLFPIITPSTERKAYWSFTNVYLKYSNVIFTRDDFPKVTGLEAFNGKMVSVPTGYVSDELITKNYPNIKLVRTDTILEGLKKVSSGQVDAFVGDIPTTIYYMRKNYMLNIKVAAPTEFKVKGFAMAIRNDWPELVSIMNKGLASINEKERQEISDKWIKLKYDSFIDYAFIWKLVSVFIVVLALILLWVRFLHKQRSFIEKAKLEVDQARDQLELRVKERTAELIDINKTLANEIEERKQAQDKLLLSAKVFNEIKEGIMITDAKGDIFDVNPAFSKITGYSRDEAIGHNPSILSSGKQSPGFFQDMWRSLHEHGYWQGEVWNRKQNGMLYAELLSISTIVDKDNNALHHVGVFTDITQSKKQQETLEKMAHYDLLTQLPNRVLLSDRFTLALAHSQRKGSLLAVCFLDLDDFKPVNDRYGHAVGDLLLVEVARRIKDSIRNEDTASRQGGDEFALLLGDIESMAQCEQTITRILELLAQPYIINDHSISISVSIGISIYPTDDADLDTLMRHADQAMYQAKLAGKNRYSLFNAEQDQLQIQKTTQLNEIRNALANDELCLYYQPKVHMNTGEAYGVEALIRWNHPEKGLVPPLLFLPIIENSDLEIQLGNWVINEALKQLSIWNELGLELEVSVNISANHLQSGNFVSNLKDALARYPKVNASYFQLEILESSALGDLKLISDIIKMCINDLDVNIALDDFGTGYSSLTHLRNLAAETIKIDQSFVRDVLDDPDDLAIIDSVIGLAKSFNRKIIAEGVETTEHGLVLLVMGCDNAQGYGIARPMPASEFSDWLNQYQPNQQWLSCVKEAKTYKEKKKLLLKLTIEQWTKHFINNINASPKSITPEQWPILDRTKCHCGIWLKRSEQDQLLNENTMKKLKTKHNAMHNMAEDLFKKYQQDDVAEARKGLISLSTAVDKIKNIF